MRKLLAFVIVCFSLYSKSQTLCAGATRTLQAVNPQNLGSPLTYSLNPGGFTSPNGTFVVSPTVTSTYTLYTTGTNSVNVIVTTNTVVTLTVFAQPFMAPTFTQSSCTNTANAFNLNLTFLPTTPVPAYTVSWGGSPIPVIPPGLLTPQQTTLTGGIPASTYTAIITTVNGCSVSSLFTMTPIPPPPSYSILPLGSNFSITCAQPTLNLSGSNPALTYTWTSANTGPIASTNVAITSTASGAWCVTGQNTVSGCFSTKCFTVGLNTTAPLSTVTPISQNVTCTNSAVSPISLFSNINTNISHYIYTQQQTTFAFNTQTASYVPPVGTHTYVLIDLANGCSTQKTFTVSPGIGLPIFTINSVPANYTLGCSTKSIITINTTTVITTPVQGAPVSYTLLSPTSSTVLPPSGNLGGSSVFTINAPGTWTYCVRDNGNTCDSRLPFTVLQNTVGPSIDSVDIPLNILNCATRSVVITGISESPNVNYSWSFISTGGGSVTVGSNSLAVLVNTIVTTNTLINTYSLTIQDNNSLCKSNTLVPMYQNLFPPDSKITASSNSSTITCATPTVLLTNSGSSGIPPNINFPHPLPVGFLWQGPSPQQPLSNSSTYLAEIPGTYTMTGKNLDNGCTSNTIFVVGDNREYPIVNSPNAPPTRSIDCGSLRDTIKPILTGVISNLSFSWTAIPGATTTSKTFSALATNLPGNYTVTVTNTLSGCSTTSVMSIKTGTLNAAIAADFTKGYAPLTVSLFNNSTSSNGNGSITTTWSFGNGTSSVTTSASISPVTVFNVPGTYVITAMNTKGICSAVAKQIIQVEVPSELSVPNVFTPNGDNINDLFFVKASNLQEIHMVIIDRWGHVTYELTTEKGQVEWDGKNQLGKDAPEGTYFYVITAKGKDDVDYNKKGTINLFR